MRIPFSMLRRLSAGILVLAFLLAAALPALADTGTYGIADYKVTLEPQSSGQVRITIEQEWQVFSGHIPWVTVGLPNSNFKIEGASGSAAKISADNGGGFTGVRIDLDKDYQPGQTFKIKFSVMQGNLLERLTADKKWRIDYTPGSYDQASIQHLQIDLISPVGYETYTTVSPLPASVNGNVVTWEKFNLAPGSRFKDKVESVDGNFLAESVPVGTSKSSQLGKAFWIIVAVIVVIGLLIFLGIRSYKRAQDVEMNKRVVTIEKEMALDKEKKDKIEKGFQEYVEEKEIKPDAGGRYYDRSYGGYVTPAIWAAILSSQFRSQNSTTGTISRPGCVSCACVSCACACACACAGGGAAGCSRKTLHECRVCSQKKVGMEPGNITDTEAHSPKYT
jgi:hypothetical protein